MPLIRYDRPTYCLTWSVTVTETYGDVVTTWFATQQEAEDFAAQLAYDDGILAIQIQHLIAEWSHFKETLTQSALCWNDDRDELRHTTKGSLVAVDIKR